MADNTIDTLSIEIQSNANGADKAIARLASALGRLETKVSGLSSMNLSNFSSSMRTLKESMSGFFGVENFEKIVVAIRKLSNVNAEKMLTAAIGLSEISNALKSMTGITIPSLEGIDKLIESTRKFGGKSVAQAVQNLPVLSDYLTRFVTSLNGVGALTFDFTGITSLVDNISRLGGAKATQAAANLKPLKDQLLRFVSGLNGIGALNFDTANLTNLVASISKLGSKLVGNAVPNMQALGVALKQLMATLSTAPAVSRNLIDMTNALANLASNGSKVSTAGRAMQNSLNGYSVSASRAAKSTRSLVSQIGLFYAKFFILLRGAKSLGNATKSAMDYIETLNYFNSAFRQVAQNADVSDWEKYGYKSAEAYANSFEQRSKQLTQKLTGFNVDESGELTRTGLPSLGLDPDKVLQYQATFAQMASSMGVASETSLKLSNALTMIGGDLASVRNLGFEEVWEDMASGMVGMSRTLDKYGVNIRNVNLQQELYNLGIDKSIAKLNQQDKAVLRTIVLLNSTRYAWGDLASTINQPANSLRLLQSNFASLARTLGALFIPIITKVLPYINALVIALQRLFAWIGGLLGIKLSGFTSSVGGAAVDMGNFAESADDAAGGLGDAAKNAKKLNGYIADWHEVNNMTSDQGKGSGGGAGGGGAGGGMPELDAALEAALAEYQKAWDKAFANMENRANELANTIVNAFKRIWETAEPTREALKRLWDEGLAKLGNFTWTALQDFWNEFLVPLGNWSLGTGLPMLIDAINTFLMSINWTDINDALRNFWQALEPFAEKVGEGLIEFFDDLGTVLAPLINTFLPPAINLLSELIKTLTPYADKLGYLIGASLAINTFSNSLKILKGIGKFVLKITGLSTISKAFITLKNIALPLATAISTKVIPTFSALFKALGGSKAASSALTFMFPQISGFVAAVGSLFTSLPGVISGGVSAIATGLGAIGSIFGLAGAAAVAAGAAVVVAIAAIIAGIIYTVTHWDEVKEFWTVKVPAFFSGTVIPFFKSIPDKIGAIWQNLVSYSLSVWNNFIDFMAGIPDKVGKILTDIWNWFNELPEQIGFALGYALGTVTKWGTDLFHYLSEKIPEIISNVVNWFLEMPGKIYTAISVFITNVVTWGAEVFEAFKTKTTEIITNVVNWYAGLPGKIYDEIIKIKEKIITWASNTITFFQKEVPKIVDEIVKLFKKLPEKMLAVGEDAIRGLWNGIKNLADWLGTNIKQFCQGVIDGFKAGFDEHSPSKKAFRIGDYFTLGLQNGIKQRFGDVLKDVKNFSDSLTSTDFGFPEIDISVPDYKSEYLKTTKPNVGSFSSTMQMEMDAKMAEYAYQTQQQNELLREQNELLRGIYNKPTLQSRDVFNAVKSEGRQYVKQYRSDPWPVMGKT